MLPYFEFIIVYFGWLVKKNKAKLRGVKNTTLSDALLAGSFIRMGLFFWAV